MVKKITFFLMMTALLLPEAALATTVTGKVTDSAGNAVAGASITFRLINIGRGNVARVSGSSMVAPTVVTATSAGDGTFTATVTGNDQISPGGTLYQVVIRGAGFTYGPFDYSITGASADLDSLTPVATFANTPSQVSVNQLTPPSGCSGALTWSNNAWSCQAVSISSPLSNIALHDKGGEKFDVLSYGLSTSNTAAENTTALNTLLATVVANHGGTIYFPPSSSPYLLNPDITIPNSGSSPYANQYPIRMEGTVARQSNANAVESLDYDADSGSVLKFTSAATNADIVTLGQGNLQIDHMTLETTSCSPFILTTQTTVRIYDNLIIGSTPAPGACNDFIVLGGTQPGSSPTVDQNFGGFGSVIRGNTFKNVRREVLAQVYANDWFLEDNDYTNTSGNPSYCAVEMNDPNNNGSLGGYVMSNLFEMEYTQCALKAVNATSPVFAFNELADFGATPNATSVVDLVTTWGAQVYAGFGNPPSPIPYVQADSQSDNYNFISSDIGVATLFNKLNANNLTMVNSAFPMSEDSNGDVITAHWSPTAGFFRAYLPSGGSQQDLYSATMGDPANVNFIVHSTTNAAIEGDGASYNFFKATAGWAELGNAADSFALGVDPADGSLKVDKWQKLNPHAFSTYPACSSSTEGDQAAITDSTTNTLGATIAGGGSNHVLGYCDGSNWTVAAK